MTQIVPVDADARIRYAERLSQAELLPKDFRGKPADVLVAMDWGESLGLTPVQAINSIYVVYGRPSLSSRAKQALAVKAGHRIRVTGNDETATAKLWRRDDPEFAYEATWTMAMAKRAGLLDKKDGSNWKTYPHVMLKRRAVSAVVEDACPELLLGMDVSDVDAADWPDEPAPVTATVERLDDTETVDTTTGEIIDQPPADLDAIALRIAQADLDGLRQVWTTWSHDPHFDDIKAMIADRKAQIEAGEVTQ